MKKIVLLLFLAASYFLNAQTIDTATAKARIDQLIGESKELYNIGEFEKALEKQDTLEKIAFDNLGKEAEEIANLLFNRANILLTQGAYTESEKWYLEALKLQEKWTGKEHEDYAFMLNNLAYLYYEKGDYEKAEEHHLIVMKIREKLHGKEHKLFAESLNNLSIVYLVTGAYEQAQPLFIETLELRKKIFGEKHLMYCGSLINLSALYLELSEYAKAEPLLLEAKEIFEDDLKDTQNPYYINCLGNLAFLYTSLGNFEKAEMFWKSTLNSFEKMVGKEHPQYATTQEGLSNMYQQMGRYEEAEKILNEALVIRDSTIGKNHKDYAATLFNLGAVYAAIGGDERAEATLNRAKEIIEEVLGKEHNDYAAITSKLADLYMKMGQFDKSEKYFLESAAAFQSAIGKENSDYASNYFKLGNLYAETNKTEKAESTYREAAELTKIVLTKSMHHMSERELNIYMNTFSDRQDRMLSFAQNTQSKSAAELCYNNSLFYKGFLLNALNQTKRTALSNPETTAIYIKLKGLNRRLSGIYSLPKIERDDELKSKLEQKINDLEKELARSVAGFSKNLQQVKWVDVQHSLKPKEAAIEFVHFDYYEKEKTDRKLYAALLIKPGFSSPKFISLFEEKSLDSLLLSHQERRSDYVNDLYTLEERGAAALNKPKVSLYDLIWSPIEKELKEVTTVYFSPSGLLHRINLNAIPTDEDFSICDQYNLIQLNSTRQLALPGNRKEFNNLATLYGGIQYEADSMFFAANSINLTDAVASRGEQLDTAKSNWRGGSWNYLRWTKKEVESISADLTSNGFDVQLHTDYRATEESFLELSANSLSPHILHIATHGFFFPDPEENSSLSATEPIFKMSDHPMIRSGLILSGGNNTWQNKSAIWGMEDGILTAMEISQMDLSDTEIVVLSACETGLGDIQGNEGVYGLQRAFKIAGVKYLIMSLWQVPDRETAQFMTTFYKHWLEDKLTIHEAFVRTQKEMKERFFNPYQWAGFVLLE